METQAKRVAVIGAGPMGLAVAYQLVCDGHHPVIYEAADRVGGMAVTFDFGGLDIERFYHFHATSDHDFETLLAELGIADKMVWRETRMGYYIDGKVQPWGNPVALLRFRGIGWLSKFRLASHAFLSIKRRDWRALDRISATGWLRSWIGAKAYDKLWRPLMDYKFYDLADSVSAAWIWARIRRVGTSRYSLMREKLGYLEGGSATYLDAIRRRIEAGGGVFHLKTPVKRVVIEAGRVQGVETVDGVAAFDHVVSTVPLPYVAPMIPDLPAAVLAKFRSQRNLAVVCVIARLKRPVTANFWLNVNDPDMDIPGIVEYTNLRPLDGHVVYVPFYMPPDHPKYRDSDEVFTAKVSRYLRRINPALHEDDILDIRASRYRFAQPVCGTGFLETLPPVDLPVAGLWVADTSYYYPEDRGISESTKFGRALARRVVA
ncbi:NAD(P)/FAD-dependent oxidoreductase [Paragemmobacter straminiformis]|uniref:NAD(P)/FAD-dependent oxidoreductase n=1 Tax=Paragemmobacter straminiformis TaxID=2045119 RepID=A0A842IBB6_9RHOB|nr:NAD(P)/FAD-dependent oxidoreductase [Gemmobacter straminiformis]MBC2836703.1 NAD(P)/FAD-dependent oxidoreductase [Gemmobacter straminiformis]